MEFIVGLLLGSLAAYLSVRLSKCYIPVDKAKNNMVDAINFGREHADDDMIVTDVEFTKTGYTVLVRKKNQTETQFNNPPLK